MSVCRIDPRRLLTELRGERSRIDHMIRVLEAGLAARDEFPVRVGERNVVEDESSAPEPDMTDAPKGPALAVLKRLSRARGGIAAQGLIAETKAPAMDAGSLRALVQDALCAAHASELIDDVIEERRKGRGFTWWPGSRILDAIAALEKAG